MLATGIGIGIINRKCSSGALWELIQIYHIHIHMLYGVLYSFQQDDVLDTRNIYSIVVALTLLSRN